MFEVSILVLASILMGYFIGKKVGQIRGLAEGKATMILILRQRSFERGYCILCNAKGMALMEESGIMADHSTNTKKEEW